MPEKPTETARLIGVDYTLDFLLSQEPAPGLSVLEIGCGDGLLLERLGSIGIDAFGIDTDPVAVSAALGRGARAEVADITTYRCDRRYDRILFSRCAHHLEAIDVAIENAQSALASEGSILFEELGHDLVNHQGATWRYDLGRVLTRRPGKVLELDTDPVAQWRLDHPADHLLSSSDLRQAVRRRLPDAEETRAAYLFRYLLEDLEGLPVATFFGRAALEWELALIRRGDIEAIGLRWLWSQT